MEKGLTNVTELVRLLSHPNTASILANNYPTWVMSSDGRWILLGNKAAASFWGQEEAEDLHGFSIPENSGVIKQIQTLSNDLKLDQNAQIALLKFKIDGLYKTFPIRCRKFMFPTEQEVIQITIMRLFNDMDCTSQDIASLADGLSGTLYIASADGKIISTSGTNTNQIANETTSLLHEILDDEDEWAMISATLAQNRVYESDKWVISSVIVEDSHLILASSTNSMQIALSTKEEEHLPPPEADNTFWEKTANQILPAQDSKHIMNRFKEVTSSANQSEEEQEDIVEKISDIASETLNEHETSELNQDSVPVNQTDISEPVVEQPLNNEIEQVEIKRPTQSKRFYWQSNEKFELVEIAKSFQKTFSFDLEKPMNWHDFVDQLNIMNGEKLLELLKSKETFTGVELLIPESGTEYVIPVRLSALPVYKNGKEFGGMNGFGVIDFPESYIPQIEEILDEVTQITNEDESSDQKNISTTSRLKKLMSGIVSSVISQNQSEEIEADTNIKDAITQDNNIQDKATQDEVSAKQLDDTNQEDDWEEIDTLDIKDQEVNSNSFKIISDGFGIFDYQADEKQKNDIQESSLTPQNMEEKSSSDDSLEDDVAKIFKEVRNKLETQLDSNNQRENDDLTDSNQNDSENKEDIVVPFGQAKDAQALRLLSGQQDKEAFKKLSESLGARIADLPESASLSDNQLDEDSALNTGFYSFETEADIKKKDIFSVLEANDDGILIYRAKHLIYANKPFLDMVGFSDLETFSAVGGIEGVFNTAHMDQQSHVENDVINLHSGDGITRQVSLSVKSLNWKNGPVTLLNIKELKVENLSANEAYLQIAERRARRAELRVRELKQLIDCAANGSVTLDNEGHILAATPAASRLLSPNGYSIVGEQLVSYFELDDRSAFLTALSQVEENAQKSHKTGVRLNLHLLAKDGIKTPIKITMIGGQIEDQQIRVFCVVEDITDAVQDFNRLEGEREKAQVASYNKTDFLSTLAHEVRNPLNAIIGFSDILREQRFGEISEQKYVEYAHDIYKSGEHAKAILDDYLDLAKAESGKNIYERETISINDVLQEATEMMQLQASEEKVILRHQFDALNPNIIADKQAIKQIALNLISNSIKFTPAGGQIIVSTKLSNDNKITAHFKDSGIGIDPKYLEKVIEPFGQLKQDTLVNRKKGTGLGLPLSKSMCEANGGSFKITSIPDKGTTIALTFEAIS